MRGVAWYYVSLLLPVSVYVGAVMLFPHPNTVTPFGRGLAITAAVAWSTSAVFALSNLAGFCLGPPDKRNRAVLRALGEGGWGGAGKLVVCYVSYGQHVDTLRAAVTQTYKVLTSCQADFRIEVVTDVPVELGLLGIEYVTVPAEYQPPGGARYKARALQYASRQRVVDGNAWVLHLDEESRLTEQSVAGVWKFMRDNAGNRVVGQGEIQYRRGATGHWLIDTADAVRAGDDLGRFRFQYRAAHRPLFGIHGSYVLVPAALEYELGFDVGERGSLTEDAYFAFEAWERGVAFSWVDGPIHEQSPHTVRDFLKQRRRWFCGLRRLAMDRRFSARTRGVLAVSVLMWAISWSCVPLAVAHLAVFSGKVQTPWATALAVVAGVFVSTYLIGSYRNSGGSWKAVARTAITLPAAAMLEGAAVLYAIARPVKDFHVVQKQAGG